ncbi:MAG: F0F1 ATP synthase subunit A [Alphaproteobacteria bacterium]|nr:F0F1 ATP synthase subunit A [Alphaproteobacteria bacterium]MCL2505577.1 F0F1 ATP synthase subunit A [Alphaproteobacteria bacterium]
MSSENIFEDFEIHRVTDTLFQLPVLGYDIALTNTAVFMLISVIGCTLFLVFAMQPRAVIPGRFQMLAEKLYDLVGNMLESGAGPKAKQFFPLVFTIFMFILFCNLFGLLPVLSANSATSHVIVNFAISSILFIVIISYGFIKHGIGWIKLFVPKGLPFFLVPILMCIELFSFLIRPFSLAIRLFGNMLAGHLLLHVFIGLTIGLLGAGWLAGLSILPFLLNLVLIGFEFFVAFLQAYIYAVLASVYLHDAVEMH